MNKFGSARVDDELTRITSKNNDVFKRAAKTGEARASARGLINSSIAVGAAEGEVLDRAIPIASQNAQQTHQRNLSDQNFQQEAKLNDQRFDQQKGLNSQQHGFNLETQANDLNNRRDIAVLDSNTRLEINQNTLDAQERAETGRQHLEADRIYQNTITALSNNPELPATERQKITANALELRNRSQAFIQTLYSVPLDWGGSVRQTAQPIITAPSVSAPYLGGLGVSR